jgi:thioredoxin reductase (NADPH)
VVRAAGLEASMSRYLIERIASTPNVELHAHTTVTGLLSTHAGALQHVGLSSQTTGESWQIDPQYMFLFIGAESNTQRLDHRVAQDDKGFVITGHSSQM